MDQSFLLLCMTTSETGLWKVRFLLCDKSANCTVWYKRFVSFSRAQGFTYLLSILDVFWNSIEFAQSWRLVEVPRDMLKNNLEVAHKNI